MWYIISTLVLQLCYLQGKRASGPVARSAQLQVAMSRVENIFSPHVEEYMYFNSICNLSAAALLYYDYALTLSREIQFLWPPHNKQGLFTLACFLNRYLPLFGYLPLVVSYFAPGSFPVCQGLQVFYHGILVSVLQTLAGTLFLIRVYALYGRSRRVLGFLLVLGSGSIISALLMTFIAHRSASDTILVVSSLHECIQYSPPLRGLYDSLTWIGVPIFDSAIFSLTLYKALTIGREIPLLDVIVRDGTMYFSLLFIMNLANILILRFSPPSLKHCPETLTNVLSTILASRLVLNLREQNSALAGLSTSVKTELKFQAALAATPMTPLEDVRVISPSRDINDGNGGITSESVTLV